MSRYTFHTGTIWRVIKVPFSYQLTPCKRVPKPVRAAFKAAAPGGFIEVEFDTKTRKANLVPFWERIQGA